MEYVDGANLRQVEQAARLAPEQALQVVPQICEALQFATTKASSTDIKPETSSLTKRAGENHRLRIAKILPQLVGRAVLCRRCYANQGGAHPAGAGRPAMALTAQRTSWAAALHGAGAGGTSAMVDHRAIFYSLGVSLRNAHGRTALGKFAAPSKKVHVDVRWMKSCCVRWKKSPSFVTSRRAKSKRRWRRFATNSCSSSGRQSAPSEAQSQTHVGCYDATGLSRTAGWAAVLAVIVLRRVGHHSPAVLGRDRSDC